uniref:ATP synthase subunit a n=1 Tax=Cynoglossus trigrammus TaxID=1572597 RepID=A0A0B5A6J8_9PLEU|nr:ATP synthase subunit 6 [Cynoglossus trigrammus]
MVMSLFDQFSTPIALGVPLIVLAMMAPRLFLLKPSSKWLISRALTLQTQITHHLTYQLFSPLGPKNHSWALLLMALMTYLVFINLLGLIPYSFTPTTQLSLNMSFAIPAWLATVIIGFHNHLTRTLAHLLPEGSPPLLIPILIIIETISLLIRPIALGVRLTANLTAGHLILHLISMATLNLMMTHPLTSLITGALLLMMCILELAVAVIQAYVFTLLLSLYLQENT